MECTWVRLCANSILIAISKILSCDDPRIIRINWTTFNGIVYCEILFAIKNPCNRSWKCFIKSIRMLMVKALMVVSSVKPIFIRFNEYYVEIEIALIKTAWKLTFTYYVVAFNFLVLIINLMTNSRVPLKPSFIGWSVLLVFSFCKTKKIRRLEDEIPSFHFLSCSHTARPYPVHIAPDQTKVYGLGLGKTIILILTKRTAQANSQ